MKNTKGQTTIYNQGLLITCDVLLFSRKKIQKNEKGEIGNCIGLISAIVSSSPISILFLKSRNYLSLMSICVYPRYPRVSTDEQHGHH
jgi:hypothetical protein